MGSKILTATVAGGLLVGAGLIGSIVSAPLVASAQENDATATTEHRGLIHRGLEFLDSVLADLVGDGTIDQSQADAITAAVQAKAEAAQAEGQAQRQLIKGFLEDGVITADELAQLPEGSLLTDPDGPFADALADGKITAEELRGAIRHPRLDAFRRGARFGSLLDDGGIDAAEYEALPEDHPLKKVDVSKYLEDGVITIDELRQIASDWRSLMKGDSPAT
jgi:hypothetical protein